MLYYKLFKVNCMRMYWDGFIFLSGPECRISVLLSLVISSFYLFARPDLSWFFTMLFCRIYKMCVISNYVYTIPDLTSNYFFGPLHNFHVVCEEMKLLLQPSRYFYFVCFYSTERHRTFRRCTKFFFLSFQIIVNRGGPKCILTNGGSRGDRRRHGVPADPHVRPVLKISGRSN